MISIKKSLRSKNKGLITFRDRGLFLDLCAASARGIEMCFFVLFFYLAQVLCLVEGTDLDDAIPGQCGRISLKGKEKNEGSKNLGKK